jgi:hypothetical protein
MIFQPFIIKNDSAIQAWDDSYSNKKNLVSRTNGTDYNNEVIVGDADVVTAIRSTTGYEPVIREGTYGSTTDYKILSEKNVAAAVADIADPTTVSTEDVANKVNELLASLRAAGLLAQ